MRRSTATRPHLLTAVAGGALAWSVLGGAALAQSTQPSQVDDVIVTATPFGVTQRATTIATDVLDEQKLAQAPAVSLGDLVNGMPGVRSTDFAPGASRPVIRGLSGPRVQVLTNGLGQIDASSVSPDHAVATDPGEAHRIEIVRGPATLVYGGSAIGGVVNIIDDRIPETQPEGGVEGRISTQYSSVDDGRGVSGHATVGAGPFAFTVSGDSAKRLSRYRGPIPVLAFTPEASVRSQLSMTWGVETFKTVSVEHTDEMVRQVDEQLLRIGRVAEGDLVVIIAGSPPGIPGSTNALRIHRMGDAINEVAPAYRR